MLRYYYFKVTKAAESSSLIAGKRCEYLVSVELVRPGTYLQLEPLHTRAPLNLTLVVRTSQQAGVLLYTGDRQHLAVELFKGRLRVSLDVGNNPASTIFRSVSTSNTLALLNQRWLVQVSFGQKNLDISIEVRSDIRRYCALSIF